MHKEFWKLFEQMEEILTDEEIDGILECELNELHKYDSDIGFWLRNRVLTPDSKLYKSFISEGVTDKTEMSDRLISDFYWNLKFKRLDEQYRN